MCAIYIPIEIDTMSYVLCIETGTDSPWQCFERHTVAIAGPARALAGCCRPCSRYAGRCRALATIQGVASALPLHCHRRDFSKIVAALDQQPNSSQNHVSEATQCSILYSVQCSSGLLSRSRLLCSHTNQYAKDVNCLPHMHLHHEQA